MTKSKFIDFICAFLICTGVFLCLALITSTDIFDNAFNISGEKVSVFGTEFVIDMSALEGAAKVFSFNDSIFGNGFTGMIKNVARFYAELVSDLFRLLLSLARVLVGA